VSCLRLLSPTTHLGFGGSSIRFPGFYTSESIGGGLPFHPPTHPRFGYRVGVPTDQTLGSLFQKPAFMGFTFSEFCSRSRSTYLIDSVSLSCRSFRRLQRFVPCYEQYLFCCGCDPNKQVRTLLRFPSLRYNHRSPYALLQGPPSFALYRPKTSVP
jgi:hypothetical protein